MTDDGDTILQAGGSGHLVTGRRVLLRCLAVLSAATAVIHFAVAGQHFAEYWLYGVFMLVVGWLQLLWAGAAFAWPARWLLWCGAALNTVVIAVYVITRTAGDIVGPAPHAVEPFGFGDGLCTVLEAVVVTGCACLLAVRADRAVSRMLLVGAPAATGGVTAVLLSVALVAGGPEMVMTVSAQAASHHVRVLTLATATPGGNITMPDPGMQMAAGMKMASPSGCDSYPTRGQQRAAVRLVDASWQGAQRFRSLAAAKAAGYVPVTPTGLPVVHYINKGYYLAMLLGGRVLNTAEPQSLVYANTPRGAVLAAAMYITSPGGPTPQPGGCLTQWHVHTNLCLAKGLGVVGVVNAAHPTCPPGSVNRVTPPMMHIWFVPIPGGPTAIDASSAPVVRAAEQVRSPANGTA